MKKRMMAMFLAALMTMGLAAGCGNKTEEASDNADDSTGSEEASDKKVEISWLHHFQEEGIQAWITDVLEKFEEENPDIKVTVEGVTQDVYDQTLKTKIASDDAPMIFDLNSYVYYKEYGDAGHLYDMSDLEGLSNIDPSMLPAGQVDGKQWGVPLDVNGYGVFYNKDIFDEYGLEVPVTREEMIAVCETLQENGVQPIAAPFAEQWCLMAYYDVIACPMYEDDEWWTKKMNLSSNFADDEKFKQAVEIFCELKPYWGNDPFGTDWDTAQGMVANGEAAMIINGAWTIDGIKTKNPDCNVRVFALPCSDSKEGAIMQLRPGSGFCLYNSQDEEKLEAGKKLMNFLTSKVSGDSFAQNASKMSVVNGVDLSFSEPLTDIQSYPDEQVWNSADVVLFSAEYEQLFYETLLNFTMVEPIDIEGLASSLDQDFAAIGG